MRLIENEEKWGRRNEKWNDRKGIERNRRKKKKKKKVTDITKIEKIRGKDRSKGKEEID